MMEQHTKFKAAGDGERLVKSAHRVMQVFELFSERRTPINATEIARGLGIPQSSTSMLLRSLTTLGYLEYQHDSRTFRPSIRLSLLAGWAPGQLPVADGLITLLRELHDSTGETVWLAAPHRHYSRSVLVLPGVLEDRHETATGELQPLCATAAGQALLTLKSEAEIRGIVRRANAEEEEASRRVSLPAILDRVARCRAEGFAHTEDHTDGAGASMFAILVPPHEDGTPLCVVAAGPSRRFQPAEAKIMRHMRDLVDRLRPLPERPELRVAVGNLRREGGFPRPDLHLVRAQTAAVAERQQAK